MVPVYLSIYLPVIYSRLSGLTAREAGRDEAHQHPTSVLLPNHERTAAVALTGILAAEPVSGAEHFRVEVDGDTLPAVPGLTLLVGDQRDIHHLQKVIF